MSLNGADRYLIIRAETSWGEYDSGGTDVAIAFWDDGFGVRPRNVSQSQLHVTGVRGDTHRYRSGKDVSGPMTLGLWPENAKLILDWATVVDGSGDLGSYTCTIVDPAVETMRYYGCRVNSLNVRISAGDPTLLLTLDLIGQYAERLTGGDIPSLPSYPSDISYNLQDAVLLLDDGDGTLRSYQEFESVDISVENNLRPGPHSRHCDANKNKTISSLRTGVQRVSGSMEVEHDRPDWTDAVLAASEGSLLLMLAHSSGQQMEVDAAGASAGSAVDIPLTADPTGKFAVGEYVFLETGCAGGQDDPDKRSIAKVTAVNTGPNSITVETLDEDVADGDHVYGKALAISAAGLQVDVADPTGGREDQRNQGIEFAATDDGTGVQFAYEVEASS